MNRSESSEPGEDNASSPASRKKFGKKTVGGVAVLILLGAYSVIQPLLNERMGWKLPALRQDSNGQVVADNRKADEAVAAQTNGTKKTSEPARDVSIDQPVKSPATTRGPLADRPRRGTQNNANSTRGSPQTSGQQTENLRYGLLRDIGDDRYLSPAGLQYGRGSQEGHRLEHIRRHTKDIPNRKGSHGVFDGEMEGALKTIDLAYQRAKQGQRTTKQTDGERTIYTIDMGKRIGFVGGESGGRKRNPMARRVRLVLEGSNVITAYPL